MTESFPVSPCKINPNCNFIATGVALVVVSAWTGFVMVTMIAEIQQTSGSVSTLLAERGSFAVAVVTVLPRSGSVMGVKIAKMLQMNKVKKDVFSPRHTE